MRSDGHAGRAGRVVRSLLATAAVAAIAVAGLVAPAAAAHAEVIGACVPAGSGSTRLAPQAAFVLPDRMQKASGFLYDQNDWNVLLTDLRASGFTSVIVQYVARTDSNTREWQPYFPDGGIYAPRAKTAEDKTQVLPKILAAAKALGMKVTIGLGLDEAGWFQDETGTESAEMTRQAQLATATADRIWSLYSAAYAGTIDGWYLPYELEGYYLAPMENVDVYQGAYVDAYLAPVSAHLKTLSGKSDISVSPLFTANADAATDASLRTAWTNLWTYVFTHTDVSILAPQDGRGSGKNTVAAVTQWFQASVAAKAASGKAGVQVWGNAESYRDQNRDVNLMPVTMLAQDLAAMRDGGATRMITFSAVSYDVGAGHAGAQSPGRVEFAAAYRAWVGGMSCPGSSSLSAPGQPVAATGADAGEAQGSGSLVDTNVTLSWLPSASSAGADQRAVVYQVRRDGRLIGEVPAGPAGGGRIVFRDYQQQAGRTLVYTVRAYDAWGTYSPLSTQAVVTIPWTAAAASTELAGQGYDIARNAPFTVTTSASEPSLSSGQLGSPSAAALLDAGTSGGGYGDGVGSQAADWSWGNGAVTDGLLGTDDTYDGRWQAIHSGSGTAQNWVMRIQVAGTGGTGTTIRQVNTQWRHHPGDGVAVPDTVSVTALTASGASVPVGSFTGAELVPAGTTAPGTYWYTATAARPIPDVTEVWLQVTSARAAQVFLGEAQAMDDDGVNRALGQKYMLAPYDASTTPAYFAGRRAWTLTDGVTASGNSQDPAWAARNMVARGANAAYVTLDLGAANRVQRVDVGTLHDPGQGIGAPATVRIRLAGASGAWGAWGSPTTVRPVSGRNVLASPLDATARFVQVELTRSAEWLFLDEVSVISTVTTNAALDKPVVLASNTAALLPAGVTPACKLSGTPCNSTANNVASQLGQLTRGAPYELDWSKKPYSWSITRFPETLSTAGKASGSGATYEVDLTKPTAVQEVTTTWLEDYGASLTLPASVTAYYLAADGTWKPLGAEAKQPNSAQEIPQARFTWTYRSLAAAPVTTSRIRIVAHKGSLKPWAAETITSMGVAQITAHSPRG